MLFWKEFGNAEQLKFNHLCLQKIFRFLKFFDLLLLASCLYISQVLTREKLHNNAPTVCSWSLSNNGTWWWEVMRCLLNASCSKWGSWYVFCVMESAKANLIRRLCLAPPMSVCDWDHLKCVTVFQGSDHFRQNLKVEAYWLS